MRKNSSIITERVSGERNPQEYGIIAQLGEHLPYKQRVIGSSPIGPIKYGEIAQLARAHGSYPWCRGFESPSRYYMKSFDLFQRIFLYTKIKYDFQQYNISKFFEGTNTKNLHLGI